MVSAGENYAQAGASKLGITMKAMDKGEIYIGELSSFRTGCNVGSSPFVTFNGFPFRTEVWL